MATPRILNTADIVAAGGATQDQVDEILSDADASAAIAASNEAKEARDDAVGLVGAAATAVQPATLASTLDQRYGDLGLRPLDHPRFSHAFVDESRNVLAYIERATGQWLLALSPDAIIDPQPILRGARFVDQEKSRSGFLFPIMDDAKKLLGGWTKHGALLAALDERSIIPAGPVAAAVRQLLASTNMGIPSGRLFFAGDSLTAGAGGGGTSYPQVMAGVLGVPYVNTAVGGTRTDSIGVRQGGIAMNLTLAADLPADTSEVDVTAYSAEFTNNQGAQSIAGMMIGMPGRADVPVTLRRYSSAAPNESTTLKYTLRRSVAGGAPIAIPAGTRFLSAAAIGNELDFHYIQGGQNNAKSTRANRIAIRDDLLRMIDRIGHDRFGLLALKPTGMAEVSGTAGYDLKMEINLLIEQAVGRHFVRTYEYLASPGALADAGITPTADDITVMNGHAIPPSLLVDAIHGNASYYTLEGNHMARWHRGQGW